MAVIVRFDPLSNFSEDLVTIKYLNVVLIASKIQPVLLSQDDLTFLTLFRPDSRFVDIYKHMQTLQTHTDAATCGV